MASELEVGQVNINCADSYAAGLKLTRSGTSEHAYIVNKGGALWVNAKSGNSTKFIDGDDNANVHLEVDGSGNVSISDDQYYQWGGTNARIVGSHSGDYVKILTGNSAKLTISSTGLATFSNGITVSGGLVSLSSFTNLDVSSGGITVTSSTHRVDTESGAATDNLNNINGGTDGSILVLRTNVDGRDVTVKDGTGNLHLAGDYALNNSARKLTLIKSGSDWFELSRSSNA